MKSTVQTKQLELSNHLLSSKSLHLHWQGDRGSAGCLPPCPVSSSSLHRKHRACLMPYICCTCAGYLALLLTHLHTSLNHPSPVGQQLRGQSCLITRRPPRVMPSVHRWGRWLYLLHGATDRFYWTERILRSWVLLATAADHWVIPEMREVLQKALTPVVVLLHEDLTFNFKRSF